MNSSNRKKGQLSIFFAMTLVLLITVVAFVINIGVFVKAKINLQNAVDAAAWSGAAVQSRLLTSIGYVNWEMRNTFKEWMFKYYGLGQISNSKTNLAAFNANPAPGQKMDFRLRRFLTTGADTETIADKWNIPSICIKLSGEAGNMCNIFTTPGLPRTATQGAVGIDETFNQAVNELVKAKSQGCIDRSIVNLRTAILWAYGPGDSSFGLFENAPVIAAQRTGAWTEALQLAFRIRNLEFLVNQPPKENICLNGANCTDVRSLNNDQQTAPLNERTVKAFWAGFRNLGNSDPRGPNEIKGSFKLTELAPRIGTRPPDTSLNNLLIPQAYDKHYLDLQLYILNYATFYSSFIPTTRTGSNATPLQGECALARVALPVPSYPLGFVKNPGTLTYYAVKGEVEFNGLFNPFANRIILKAYAAAKPFGGRIGPALFNIVNDQEVRPRQQRSFSYASGIQINANAPTTNTDIMGRPVPSKDFWVENANNTIGGIPAANNALRFVIPNLIYDVPPGADNLQTQVGGTKRVEIITQMTNQDAIANEQPNPNPGTEQIGGLYESIQFKMMMDSLVDNGDGLITKEEVDKALINVRRPTRYEMLNYMIPTVTRPDAELDDPAAEQENANNVVTVAPGDSPDGRLHYKLYAPLFVPGLLYNSPADIEFALNDHLQRGLGAVQLYSESLAEVAQFSRQMDANTAQNLYQGSATNIHNGATPQDPTCPSLAGNFRYFFTGQGGGQPGDGCLAGQFLKNIVTQSLFNKINNFPGFAEFINPTYPIPEEVQLATNNKLRSAYAPGPRHGAAPNGEGKSLHPFIQGVRPVDVHRNFYSTKFVPVNSLFKGKGNSYVADNFVPYVEGGDMRGPEDLKQGRGFDFINPIDESSFTSEFDPENRGITH